MNIAQGGHLDGISTFFSLVMFPFHPAHITEFVIFELRDFRKIKVYRFRFCGQSGSLAPSAGHTTLSKRIPAEKGVSIAEYNKAKRVEQKYKWCCVCFFSFQKYDMFNDERTTG